MNELRLVFCTFPSIESARKIGSVLIEQQLAACVNFVPQIESIYHWNGQICTDHEILAIFKTTKSIYPQLEELLKKSHPYETPEIVAIEPVDCHEAYYRWILQSLQKK